MLKTIFRIIVQIFLQILSITFSCLIFLLLNIANTYINNEYFNSIMFIINSKLLIIILYTLIFSIADIIRVAGFPINLIVPVLRAFGTFFSLRVISEIVFKVLEISNVNVPDFVYDLQWLIYVIIIIIVLIVGYTQIFHKKPKESWLNKLLERKLYKFCHNNNCQ